MNTFSSRSAEESVLGALLLDNAKIEKINLKTSDFFDLRHQLIFQSITKLITQHGIGAADVITVAEDLINSGSLKREEIAGYTIELVQSTPSAANILRYERIVKDYSQRRRLYDIGNNLITGCFDRTASVQSTFKATQNSLTAFADENSEKQIFFRLPEILDSVILDIQNRIANPKQITGLKTGFFDFDKITHGLQQGELIIIGGRPSMGKTAFAMNIAENVALNGGNILIFSMEMSKEQLIRRMIGSVAMVEQDCLITGKFDGADFEKYVNAVEKLSKATLTINEQSCLTVSEIIEHCRTLSRTEKIDLIVIDYLQLMSGENEQKNSMNRNLELSDITRRLKRLAKELKTPLILLSQINRDNTKRVNKRPTMADLRDSGAIEQDADLILLLHREDYYHKNEQDYTNSNQAELIIDKHRNGSTGVVNLAFFEKYASFRNSSREEYKEF